jgi:glycosyltransferase involved in cell wall biosynthesis
MPKVSVIIPNYNHARFLEQRIQSILDQTYQDFEIIYLDDCSTDNSNEVFAKFADNPRFRAIYNQTNSGSPFKQWNKGIKHANGEYIWLAEADDYAEPKFLETLVPLLDDNPQVGLVYCQSWRVDEIGNITHTLKHWTDNLSKEHWHNNFVNSGLDECTKYLVFQNTISNASAVLVRRKLYEEIGYADESMTFCGDWITWVKLLLISDLAFIAKPLNYFRFHTSSVSSKSISNGIYVYEKSQIINFINQHVNLPRQTLETVSEKVIDEWVSLTVRGYRNIPRERYWKIYGIVKKIEPRLEFKFINKLANYYLNRIKHKVNQFFVLMGSLLHNLEGY